MLPSDFTLDPPLCFTYGFTCLACHVYHISRHNIHIKWILLRVILHASWNMRFSIHQHSWVKPLLHRRLSLSLRPWKIATPSRSVKIHTTNADRSFLICVCMLARSQRRSPNVLRGKFGLLRRNLRSRCFRLKLYDCAIFTMIF